ncbi:hypothetical protein F503_04035 [Ophiostoma piceae UAMH 11346]|uniref:Uncharacterized protein n=1 Tax=Ophiostoma piceae (strain UAMH 11346) TaxID=1262450 RepID=S3BTF9_OPHP1|nr:hypothetical protein F503_04035 [Ophiostoma piceae UAMH 11346]
MVASKLILSSVLAAGASASISPRLAEALAARQVAPGTDLYNCHDNCGNAILAIHIVTAGASMRSVAAGMVGAAAFGAAYVLAF